MLFSGFAWKQEGIVSFSLKHVAVWRLGTPAYGAVRSGFMPCCS